MKRYLLLLFLALPLVGGCCSPCGESGSVREKPVHVGVPPGLRPVVRFTYDGHHYLKFGTGNFMQLVHDPSCPCGRD
jgi:hypothetical protein